MSLKRKLPTQTLKIVRQRGEFVHLQEFQRQFHVDQVDYVHLNCASKTNAGVHRSSLRGDVLYACNYRCSTYIHAYTGKCTRIQVY